MWFAGSREVKLRFDLVLFPIPETMFEHHKTKNEQEFLEPLNA